jgi:hypothetical protein
MGWSSATYIMQNVIAQVSASPRFADDFDARKDIYRIVFKELENGDWDCQEECLGQDKAYDAIFLEKYPDYELEDESYQDEEE